MKVDFYVQDPTSATTTYLYESILESVEGATHWVGMYAFASRGGVDHLVTDPLVHDYLAHGGSLDLVVGLDAVTDVAALTRLSQVEEAHPRFAPRVFWNESSALFHPKLSLFHYPDGGKRLIVGSGNLTPGGMRKNYEAFTVVSSAAGVLDTTCFEEFIDRHAEKLRVIDQEVLDRASRNRVVRRPRFRPSPNVDRARAADSNVLLAYVPAAGNRWSQVHFNKDVIESFFKVLQPRTERVYLRRIEGVQALEEVRPVVFSNANKNYKIEISAAKHQQYPADGKPILVMVERAARCFDYLLLMPGDPGYSEMDHLLRSLPSIGKGFHRARTRLEDLSRAWPACPLASSIQADTVEI